MKVLRKVLKYLAILVALLVVISIFLPAESHVSRSISISAPPEKLYSYVNSLSEFNRWSPWQGLDPDAVVTYSGSTEGIGASMQWSSENPSVGSGIQTIVDTIPNEMVETRLEFDGQGDAIARWLLEPVGSETRITWELSTEWGYNPMGRYMGLMMDTWVGGPYEEGLRKLKLLVESE